MDIRIKKSIETIKFIVEDLQLDNPKQLADSLGFKRPERIYKILRGETAISRNLADIIHKKYPQYSKDWLLTGEGEMLHSEKQDENSGMMRAEDSPEISYGDVKAMHADIKSDLKALAEGMTHNFNLVSNGIVATLQGQRKILDFIENLDADEIKAASNQLAKFLEEH